MYVFRNEGISCAEDRVVAIQTTACIPDDYQFRRLEYPNIYIPNRGAAWSISFKPEDSEEKSSLRRNVKSYNYYLDRLDSIKGFRDYFAEHHCCVSREEITKEWSRTTADFVFSKEAYIFQTDLRVLGDYLIDASVVITYSAFVDGEEISIPVGKDGGSYPTGTRDKRIVWNWMDNGHDFCMEIWDVLGSPCWENEDVEENENAVSYCFDAYSEFRDEDPEPQLVRIFSKLENLGYIKTCTIAPEAPDLRWKYFCKSDSSVDCAIIDTSFLKNRLVMEQIDQLLWCSTDELRAKPYFITTAKNKQELSAFPGAIGGHKKLKIYGRLDCPSAKKYLAKGQYAKNRVFFLDEETAITAGYRPCAICMPEQYAKWKAQK